MLPAAACDRRIAGLLLISSWKRRHGFSWLGGWFEARERFGAVELTADGEAELVVSSLLKIRDGHLQIGVVKPWPAQVGRFRDRDIEEHHRSGRGRNIRD